MDTQELVMLIQKTATLWKRPFWVRRMELFILYKKIIIHFCFRLLGSTLQRCLETTYQSYSFSYICFLKFGID